MKLGFKWDWPSALIGGFVVGVLVGIIGNL